MPSTIPVAAAGISRRARTGHTIQFSAAESVKTAPGQRLVYRWTITSRPSGSRARLQNASSAHPLLRPDRPGRYVVRVSIFELSAAAASGPREQYGACCARAEASLSLRPRCRPRCRPGRSASRSTRSPRRTAAWVCRWRTRGPSVRSSTPSLTVRRPCSSWSSIGARSRRSRTSRMPTTRQARQTCSARSSGSPRAIW